MPRAHRGKENAQPETNQRTSRSATTPPAGQVVSVGADLKPCIYSSNVTSTSEVRDLYYNIDSDRRTKGPTKGNCPITPMPAGTRCCVCMQDGRQCSATPRPEKARYHRFENEAPDKAIFACEYHPLHSLLVSTFIHDAHDNEVRPPRPAHTCAAPLALACEPSTPLRPTLYPP